MAQFFESTKSFFFKCRRVWLVLRKPTKKEYLTVAKVSSIGIALLGAIGFVISVIIKLFFA